MKQGEVLFAVKNTVLETTYEWLTACWYLLRFDKIALIVQNYRMTECKNKRHKQVCHCLLNTYKQVVSSVNWESIFLNLHYFLCCRGMPLTLFLQAVAQLPRFPLSHITLPLPETAANQLQPARSLSLPKNQPVLFEQTDHSSETLPDLMAFSGNLGSNSGMSAQRGTQELQLLRSTLPFGEIPALRAS